MQFLLDFANDYGEYRFSHSLPTLVIRLSPFHIYGGSTAPLLVTTAGVFPMADFFFLVGNDYALGCKFDTYRHLRLHLELVFCVSY